MCSDGLYQRTMTSGSGGAGTNPPELPIGQAAVSRLQHHRWINDHCRFELRHVFASAQAYSCVSSKYHTHHGLLARMAACSAADYRMYLQSLTAKSLCGVGPVPVQRFSLLCADFRLS